VDIRGLNLKVLKLNQNALDNDQESLTDHIIKGLKRNINETSAEDLSPRNRSSLLSHRLGDNNIPTTQLEYYKKLEHIPTRDLVKHLPENKKLFFLNNLKKTSVENFQSLLEISKKYSVDSRELSDLKNSGFLEWAEPSDSREILAQKGLLKTCTEEERKFLQQIAGFQIAIDSEEFKSIALKNGINNEGLDYLISEKFISGVTQEQVLNPFNCPDKSRIRKLPAPTISENLSLTLESNEVCYINDLLQKGSNRTELREKHSISPARAFKLEQMTREDGNVTYHKLDKEIKTNPSPFKFLKVKYDESHYVLSSRVKEKVETITRIGVGEINLLLKAVSGSPLSNKDFTSLLEFKFNDLKISNSAIPSPNEIFFLNNINARSFSDIEKIKEIGLKDYGIPTERTTDLFSLGIIHADHLGNGEIRISSKFKITNELKDAYTWAYSNENDHIFLEKHLAISRPNETILSLISNKEKATPSVALMDYNIFFKLKDGNELTAPELKRLDLLRMNGIHIEKNYDFLKEEPASFRLKKARNDSLIRSFIAEKNINIEILDEVNTFKQVSEDYLLKRGLTKSDLDKYSQGGKFLGVEVNGKLLNKHYLGTPAGPITYYSIAHSGIISGRSILEQFREKNEISKSPQKRQDLLFHDLKAADCVLVVKNELEGQGLIVKKILNESAQYSENKMGKLNNERLSGPAFMDAQIIIEIPEGHENYTPGGKNTKTIAVEYGNYSNERMVSKVENSIFDEAFVFSNKTHTMKYSKVISSSKVHLRSM